MKSQKIIELDAETLFKTKEDWVLPENINRFILDWNNRLSIPNKKVSSMTNPFWVYYNNVYNSLSEQYDTNYEFTSPYTIAKPAIIAFSGGIESIITKNSVPEADILHVKNLDNLPGTVEGYLAIIGAALGYATTFIGIEEIVYGSHSLYKNEDDIPLYKNLFLYELSNQFITDWNQYAYPATIQSAVICWNRIELFEKIIKEGLLNDIKSCFNYSSSEQWCGNCYKCFEAHHIIKFLLYTGKVIKEEVMPCIKNNQIIPLKENMEKAYFDQFGEFMATGKDTFMNLGIYDYMLDYGYDFRKES